MYDRVSRVPFINPPSFSLGEIYWYSIYIVYYNTGTGMLVLYMWWDHKIETSKHSVQGKYNNTLVLKLVLSYEKYKISPFLLFIILLPLVLCL